MNAPKANAAETLETETVVLIPLDQCHKSPSQPRRRDGEKIDDDFVASIREKGVLQPIIVRVRKAGGWEIVFGHRRQVGSVRAERETIPAIVREMTDEEVFEAQLIENIHRADMHPLDEADGFKRMMDKGKKTIPEIAAKIGRPATYVAQRLKLCELGSDVRAALDKEEISLGVAVLLARVPPSLQSEALRDLTENSWDGPPSVADAKKQLEEEYLLRLDRAPFDIASADLVPKAGACTACPKRTGQQRELFPDAARADMCTDRVCFRGKLDAVWQIRVKEAKAGGTTVLEGKEAEKALRFGGSGYKKLDDEEWVDNGKNGGSHKKIRTILGKELPPISLARDEETGAIVELVRQADVAKVMRKNAPVRTSGGNDDYREQERRREAKDRQRAAAVDQALSAAVEKVGKLAGPKLTNLLVRALIIRSWSENQMAVMRRRGIDPEKGRGRLSVEERLMAHFKTLDDAGVGGLGMELALRLAAPGRNSSASPVWGETLKALGIDFAAIEKQIAADAKAKKKAKAGKRRAA